MTRPGTPDQGGSAEDADWTFAQREAALARLHGIDPGLESLPDEDLNKLFDRVTKLKNMRNTSFKARPESSLGLGESNMSLTDDVWSDVAGLGFPAPASDAQTDDTSLETNGPGSPEVDDTMKDLQGQLESARLEFESRLEAAGQDTEEQTENLIVEKEHMEHQLKMIQNQMKRLMELKQQGAPIQEEIAMFEPTLYRAKELRLIRKVLDKWRKHRSFSMAETVLSGAVLLKEANIIRSESEFSVNEVTKS